MKSLFVVLSTVAILASCGRQESAAELSAARSAQIQNQVVLMGYSAEAVNGGINPTSRALKITAQFIGGSNACVASQFKFEISQVVKGNETHIVVTKNPKFTQPRMCPMNYMPVPMSLSTTVFGKAGQVVFVDNVASLGANVRLSL